MPWTYGVIEDTLSRGNFPSLDNNFKLLRKKRKFMKGCLISLCVSVVTVSLTLILSDALDTIPLVSAIKKFFQGAVVFKAVLTIGSLSFLFWRAHRRCLELRQELEDEIYRQNICCR